MWPDIIACRKYSTKIGTHVDITISRGVPKVAYCKTPVVSYALHKIMFGKKCAGSLFSRIHLQHCVSFIKLSVFTDFCFIFLTIYKNLLLRTPLDGCFGMARCYSLHLITNLQLAKKWWQSLFLSVEWCVTKISLFLFV